MRADRFLLPNKEENLGDLSGGRFFTSLDLFQGYWKVTMAEEYKDVETFT